MSSVVILFSSFSPSCFSLGAVKNSVDGLVAGLQTSQLFTVTQVNAEIKSSEHATFPPPVLCAAAISRREDITYKSGEPSSFSVLHSPRSPCRRYKKVCFHGNERIKGKGTPSQNDASDLGEREKINHPRCIDKGKWIGFLERELQKQPAVMDLVCRLIILLNFAIATRDNFRESKVDTRPVSHDQQHIESVTQTFLIT